MVKISNGSTCLDVAWVDAKKFYQKFGAKKTNSISEKEFFMSQKYRDLLEPYLVEVKSQKFGYFLLSST